jgi:hypothetical protein
MVRKTVKKVLIASEYHLLSFSAPLLCQLLKAIDYEIMR